MPAGLEPVRSESDKQRFLENLWHVQAMYRSRAGQSVVLQSEDQEVECRAGKTTFARAYFNVYQRTAFLQEQKKVNNYVAHLLTVLKPSAVVEDRRSCRSLGFCRPYPVWYRGTSFCADPCTTLGGRTLPVFSLIQ